MKRTVGPFQRLGVIVLIVALGGCELMKHVRIQTDDQNPNSFVDARADTPRGQQSGMKVEFRLWPQEEAR